MATCQICGRTIKVNQRGGISHHGYKRPGPGWQTASCRGANYLPYEQSRNRIPGVVSEVQDFVKIREAQLKALIETPPATLTTDSFLGGLIELRRPENFNPASYYSGIPRTYENEYGNRVRAARADIKGSNEQIAFLRRRFFGWKHQPELL